MLDIPIHYLVDKVILSYVIPRASSVLKISGSLSILVDGTHTSQTHFQLNCRFCIVLCDKRGLIGHIQSECMTK